MIDAQMPATEKLERYRVQERLRAIQEDALALTERPDWNDSKAIVGLQRAICELIQVLLDP